MDKTREHMIKIGQAMLTLGLQNTHSGNISCRVGEEIYITKTGSMKGHLKERDIIIVGVEEPMAGLFQASSETGTHKEILKYSKASLHAHSLPATLLSYFAEEVEPIDFLGRHYLQSIPVIEFEYPVGSREMEEEIPEVLKETSAVNVGTHGPFVRGSSLNEAFFILCVMDYSSEILLNLKILGVDLSKVPELNYPEASEYQSPEGFKETGDEELIKQFVRTSSDLFTMRLSPFHTGSLSVRDGKEMIYSSRASSPDYLEIDMVKMRIDTDDDDDFFKKLHKAVYRFTSAESVIFTHSPYAVIQSLKLITEGSDRIIPVDAEGGYLYPAVPVLLPDEDIKTIIEKSAKYKMVALAGMGVLAIGHTPGHTIHHSSSIRNICYLKTYLKIMNKTGVIEDVARFLDERGKNW